MKRFRAAVHAASNAVARHVDDMAKQVWLEPHFNVLGAAKAIPWDTLWTEPILEAWEKDAAVVMVASRSQHMGKRRVAKDDVAPSENIPLQPSEELALQWLEEQGLGRVQAMTEQSRAAVIDVLDQGLREGWSIQRMVSGIRGIVGLNPRLAAAVTNRRALLERQGLPPGKVAAEVDRYRKKMVRVRAEMIARTETISARNEGQLQAWQTLQSTGDLPFSIKRVWIPASKCCDLCSDLGKEKPVGLLQPFSTGIMRPPAHPNCRCSMGLAD